MSANVVKGLLLVVALVAITVAFIRFNRVVLPEGPVDVVIRYPDGSRETLKALAPGRYHEHRREIP